MEGNLIKMARLAVSDCHRHLRRLGLGCLDYQILCGTGGNTTSGDYIAKARTFLSVCIPGSAVFRSFYSAKSHFWANVGNRPKSHVVSAVGLTGLEPHSTSLRQAVFPTEPAKNKSFQTEQAERSLQSIEHGIWSLLLYLTMRDEFPGVSKLLILSISMLSAIFLSALGNLFGCALSKVVSSCQESDAQSGIASRGENGKDKPT